MKLQKIVYLILLGATCSLKSMHIPTQNNVLLNELANVTTMPEKQQEYVGLRAVQSSFENQNPISIVKNRLYFNDSYVMTLPFSEEEVAIRIISRAEFSTVFIVLGLKDGDIVIINKDEPIHCKRIKTGLKSIYQLQFTNYRDLTLMIQEKKDSVIKLLKFPFSSQIWK